MATWGSSVSKASDLVPYFGFKFRFLIHILNVSSTVVEREQEVWSSTLPPIPPTLTNLKNNPQCILIQ